MATTTTFPLLTLPFVPLQDVLSFWTPVELILFSFCSKRTRQKATGLKKSRFLIMEINSVEDGFIKIWFRRDGHDYGHYNFGIKKNRQEEVYQNNRTLRTINGYSGYFYFETQFNLITHWNNQKFGQAIMAEYISDIFNILPISRFYTYGDFVNRSLIEWMKQCPPGTVHHWCARSPYQSDNIEYLWNSCQVAKRIEFHFDRNHQNGPYKLDFNLDKICIFNAYWLTLDHLITMSNQTTVLALIDSSLGNKDWNAFIKHWLSIESNPKMKHLTMTSPRADLNEILSGIEYEKFDEDNVSDVFPAVGSRMTGGFKIRRKDGMVASMSLDRDWFNMVIESN